MFPDPTMDAVLIELEERRREAEARRRARACRPGRANGTLRLRRALGGPVLRLGVLLLGEDGRLRADAGHGG